MNENKLIDEFWKDCEMSNFSKEATVLFFHLLSLHRQYKRETLYLHPAALLSKIIGYNQAAVTAASEELQNRGYIEYTPAEGARTSGIYKVIKLEPIKRRAPRTKSVKVKE
jgi:DNA-binding MarR family transcriptional regulator